MTGTAVAANPELNRRVGRELRRLRRSNGHSLHDTVRLSGLGTASVLGAYERGERTISLPAFVALCLFYKADPSETLAAATFEDVASNWPAIGGRADVVINATGGAS